jgi:hypothetical protein
MNGNKGEITVKQNVCDNEKIQVSGPVANPKSREEYRQFVEVHERNMHANLEYNRHESTPTISLQRRFPSC